MQLLKELTRVWQLDSCLSQAWQEEGSPMMMQLLKELTRVWQLDSCYQPGWAGGREPYDGAAA
jgi:hypothetical protein